MQKEYILSAKTIDHAGKLAKFIRSMEIKDSQALALDECWRCASDTQRPRGRSKAGTPCTTSVRKLYSESRRWAVLGVCSKFGMLHEATFITQETLTAEVFSDWLINSVLPLTTAFPGPRSVILADNAPFHNWDELNDACIEAGVLWLPLPPRQPQDNPIEWVWSDLRRGLFETRPEEFDRDPEWTIRSALERIPASHFGNFFKHCLAPYGVECA